MLCHNCYFDSRSAFTLKSTTIWSAVWLSQWCTQYNTISSSCAGHFSVAILAHGGKGRDHGRCMAADDGGAHSRKSMFIFKQSESSSRQIFWQATIVAKCCDHHSRWTTVFNLTQPYWEWEHTVTETDKSDIFRNVPKIHSSCVNICDKKIPSCIQHRLRLSGAAGRARCTPQAGWQLNVIWSVTCNSIEVWMFFRSNTVIWMMLMHHVCWWVHLRFVIT